MSSKITIQTLDTHHYVGVRRVVQRDGIGAACADILPRVARWLAGRNLRPAGPPTTIYHSVNRETGAFDIQPCFFVSTPIEPDGDITPGQTAEGSVLVATHVGPYETLGDTWHALFTRAQEMDRLVTKSSWEVYVDDPGEVEAAKLRTQIFVPINDG